MNSNDSLCLAGLGHPGAHRQELAHVPQAVWLSRTNQVACPVYEYVASVGALARAVWRAERVCFPGRGLKTRSHNHSHIIHPRGKEPGCSDC